MKHTNAFLAILLTLSVISGSLFVSSPAGAAQALQSSQPSRSQVVLTMDVSPSMDWYILPDTTDLPQDLLAMRERLEQIESDPEYQRLVKAEREVDDLPEVLPLMEAYNRAWDAQNSWLAEQGHGEAAEYVEKLQQVLDSLGCMEDWGADSLVWNSNNWEELKNLIGEQDCSNLTLSDSQWQQIKDVVPFMDDPEYQTLHKDVDAAWDAYNEKRQRAAGGVAADYQRYLLEQGYTDVQSQFNQRAGALGMPTKLDLAKRTAHVLLDLLRLDQQSADHITRLALLDFAFLAKVRQEFTEEYPLVGEKIDQLKSRGFTNIGDGLDQSLKQIENNGEPGLPSAIILLSDGVKSAGMSTKQILETIPPRARQLNTRICAVAFGMTVGDANTEFLQDLAEATDGAYTFAKNADELARFFIACRQGLVATEVKQLSGVVQNNQTVEAGTVQVQKDTSTFSLTLAYLTGDMTLELVDPTGMVVDASYPGVSIESGENLQVVTIDNPLPSDWVVRVRAKEVPAEGGTFNVITSSTVGAPAAPTPTQTAAAATATPAPAAQTAKAQPLILTLLVGFAIFACLVVLLVILYLWMRRRERKITPLHIGGAIGLLVLCCGLTVGVSLATSLGGSGSPVAMVEGIFASKTPTLTATSTLTPTPPFTPTPTHTLTPTPTLTPTLTPTPTATPAPVAISSSNAGDVVALGEPIENQARAYYLALSPDGSILASPAWYFPPPPADGVPAIRLWYVYGSTLVPFGRLISPDVEEYINAAAFSPDGRYLAAGMASGAIQLWDVNRREMVRKFSGHSAYVTQLDFSPDGELLVSSADDKSVRLWNVSSGQQTQKITLEWEAYSVAFSPDGLTFATGSRVKNKEVQTWEASSGRLVRTFRGHGNTVLDVSFSPDGGVLASASMDENIILWDVASGRQLKKLSGHSDIVRTVVFSPDGSLVASAGNDSNILVWSVWDGDLLATLRGHLGRLYQTLVFMPNGGMLISSANDSTIRFWGLRP
ncbi:MAG: VWA domain-containing protein [Anaerolineales bacterium]|nr:VWA domain-containing protein [Anaerolineales bacterium]